MLGNSVILLVEEKTNSLVLSDDHQKIYRVVEYTVQYFNKQTILP